MAPVNMDKLNKVYENGFHAVKDMSLDIADGEFMVLVGPSGCGKTTALRMVAGLEDITSGILRIGGKEVNDETPKERDIAMVFQNYALYPHMTVRDNIGFALKLRKTPKPELKAKVDEAAEILGLTDWLDRKPGQLSGGQRQRVAMGRAIVRQPSVFLMALTFNSANNYRTIPVGIAEFGGNFQVPYGTIFAASVVAVVPIGILVFIFRKFVISGLTSGAVKG